MSNPWIVPMWITLALECVFNGLMLVTRHTPSWAPITAMFAGSFILWAICAFKAWRYDR